MVHAAQGTPLVVGYLWHAFGVSLYAVMIPSFYQTMRDNAAMMEQYVNTLPKTLMHAFGITDMASLPRFIGESS